MTRNYLTVIVISNFAFVELLLTCRAGLDVVVDELFCIINLQLVSCYFVTKYKRPVVVMEDLYML
jgi:hypothetical protein